ncbi:MAG: glucose-1-phosphate adenylyltransferase [Zetaproteobacteria bacterium]|nr:MAG: glucose-1-phosphate adenylyltransferase [Zetaproteobacteria bacterium]
MQMQRHISLLTSRTIAVVLAGGRGTRLGALTRWRAKPAVPFGGKFRIIDFPLSNCVNSGVRRIFVLTQYKSHSLQRHLQRGWNFLAGQFGEFLEVLSAQQRVGEHWYTGTADAVYQNLDILLEQRPEHVLILAGDHIYKMDYGKMIAFHAEQDADVTVGCIRTPIEVARGALGVMKIDEHERILAFQEKPQDPAPIPGDPEHCLASMGIYVFRTEYLREALLADAADSASKHDFGFNVIPKAVQEARVFAFRFVNANTGAPGYWRDVGTIDAYWEANIDLANVEPQLNLYDERWPIWTYQEQLPPAKFVFDDDGRRGMAVDSLVSGGCIVSGGTVRHSVLFSGVRVHSFSLVEDSVVLPYAEIGRHARIRRAVIEKGTKIPEGLVVGEDPEEDARRFVRTPGGVVVITPEMLGQKRPFLVGG